MTTLLTIGNPKTIKGQKRGYYTAAMHFAPYKLSGRNVCPMAGIAGCSKPCLNTAGRGGIIKKGETTNVIQKARIKRTNMFFEKRSIFNLKLKGEMYNHMADAEEQNLEPCFRLDATSDIGLGKRLAKDYPNVMFYDYTKIPSRALSQDKPKNYHVTMSYYPNMNLSLDAFINNGVNVAVVFRLKPSQDMPVTWKGFKVIDGDDHDLRFLDPKGVIVGLRAKGPAKKDNSGFVIDIEQA